MPSYTKNILFIVATLVLLSACTSYSKREDAVQLIGLSSTYYKTWQSHEVTEEAPFQNNGWVRYD